jgi:hypothetical protein
VPGIPLGVQLEPVFQLVEVLPFQVYETWETVILLTINKKNR